MHDSVQRGHSELQAARVRRRSAAPRCRHRLGLRNDLVRRPPLLRPSDLLKRGGPAPPRRPVGAARRHPDGDFAANADHRRRHRRVFVIAETRYGALRYARRAGPARGRGEVREEGRVRALAEAEGEGHFLFADGLVEEAYVSVDLRKKTKRQKQYVRSCRRRGEEEEEKRKTVGLPSRRPLARGRLSLESRARPPRSTSLDVVGAREWCSVLLSLYARRWHGKNRDGVMEKGNAGGGRRTLTRLRFCEFWGWLGITSTIAGQLDLRLGCRALLFHDDAIRLRVLLSLAHQRAT